MIANTFESTISDILNWLWGSISTSVVISVIVLFVSFYIFTYIAKKYIVQLLLVINVWLPSVVMSFIVDFSGATNKIIDPKGIALVLFPYTWDLCCSIDAFRTVSLIMIVLSYVTFVHAGMLFCHYLKISKLWGFLVGYALLLGFGLGMVNFHTTLVSGYIQASFGIGLHPLLLPMIVISFLLIYLFYTYGFKKRKIVKI